MVCIDFSIRLWNRGYKVVRLKEYKSDSTRRVRIQFLKVSIKYQHLIVAGGVFNWDAVNHSYSARFWWCGVRCWDMEGFRLTVKIVSSDTHADSRHLRLLVFSCILPVLSTSLANWQIRTLLDPWSGPQLSFHLLNLLQVTVWLRMTRNLRQMLVAQIL